MYTNEAADTTLTGPASSTCQHHVDMARQSQGTCPPTKNHSKYLSLHHCINPHPHHASTITHPATPCEPSQSSAPAQHPAHA
jgi:hypothetical protein